MPTYVYKCDTCEEEWEESLPYEARDLPTAGTGGRTTAAGRPGQPAFCRADRAAAAVESTGGSGAEFQHSHAVR